MSSADSRARLRDAVLDAALRHVAFDGWTATALERGAADAGQPKLAAHRAFPGGPAEAIAYWSRRADARMAARLARTDLAKLRFRERVRLAVLERIADQAAEREALKRALAYLALPAHAALAAKLLYRTADAIWRAVGDTATDFSFYTKRASLGAVYAATLLVRLEDDSAGAAATAAFLDRRIEDVMRIPKLRARLAEAAGRLPDPFALLRRLCRA